MMMMMTTTTTTTTTVAATAERRRRWCKWPRTRSKGFLNGIISYCADDLCYCYCYIWFSSNQQLPSLIFQSHSNLTQVFKGESYGVPVAIFSRPDGFPVSQPTASKQGRPGGFGCLMLLFRQCLQANETCYFRSSSGRIRLHSCWIMGNWLRNDIIQWKCRCHRHNKGRFILVVSVREYVFYVFYRFQKKLFTFFEMMFQKKP